MAGAGGSGGGCGVRAWPVGMGGGSWGALVMAGAGGEFGGGVGKAGTEEGG